MAPHFSCKFALGVWILFFLWIPSALSTPDLEHAVGQMMMVGFAGTTINDDSPIVVAIKKYHIGGVILFDHFDKKKNGVWIPRNIENPQQLKHLTQALQHYAKQYGDYPLLIAVNQEGGLINTLQANRGFDLDGNESERQLGIKSNREVITKQALYRGRLLRNFNINLNLAPVADLDINPKNPAVGLLQRSFGRNPLTVTNDLKAAILAYRRVKIECTLKHFPGLGSADKNTDFSVADVTDTWSAQELIPYQKLIHAHQTCSFIMTSHLVNRRLDSSGLPLSLSPMVTQLLRHQLHFEGVIITDDMDVAAIRRYFSMEKAIRLAVLAGNNIILYGGVQGHDPAEDADKLFHTLLTLSQHDKKIRERVYESYERIREVKRKTN